MRVFTANVNLALRRQVRNLQGKLWLEESIDSILFEWVRTAVHRRNDWRRAFGMLQFSWNIYRAGLHQGTRPDVIIGSSPHPFAAYAGYCLARRLNSRFFLELRDLWPQALVDMNGIPARHPVVQVMRCLERQLYNHSDHIIVLARGSVPYLKERGVPEKHITCIPNGVHPNHFVHRRTRKETRYLYGFDRFTVVYTGAHGPANALHTILEAAAELECEPGIEFVLVGDGPVKIDLQARAREMGLKNLRFIDPVPKQDIPDLLLAADAAVITLKDVPAFYKAVSPNKLYDYLAAGKPVLCAAPGDVAKMVEQYRCGLTSPAEDGKALAKQVKSLAALPQEEYNEMGARGRKLVLDLFSRTKLVMKLIELIEDKT